MKIKIKAADLRRHRIVADGGSNPCEVVLNLCSGITGSIYMVAERGAPSATHPKGEILTLRYRVSTIDQKEVCTALLDRALVPYTLENEQPKLYISLFQAVMCGLIVNKVEDYTFRVEATNPKCVGVAEFMMLRPYADGRESNLFLITDDPQRIATFREMCDTHTITVKEEK